MTDVAIGEALPALAPPIPPGPESTAELDAAAPQAAAVDGLAPATDDRSTNVEDGSGNTNDDNGVRDETSTNVESAAAPAAERPLPFDVEDVEHLGILRRSVLDHLADTEGPQSVAQILASMPAGTTRGSGESAIRREWEADRIERVGAGLYMLAKPKPPKQAKPTRPSPVAPEDEQVWLAAFEAWVVSPDSWDREKLGPRPNEPGRRIPADIVAKGVDRSRKRKERRKEAEAAAAKRVDADRELRDRLIAATGGNVIRGPALDDVAPIRLALEVVPIDRVLSAIRSKTDKKMYPGNEPATSWREPRLLREIADCYFRSDIGPRLVDAWSKAGRAPAPTAPSSPPAADVPDDADELRRRHDQEHAPPGPHSLAADAAPDMPATPVERAEPPPAVEVSPEPESAPETPPPMTSNSANLQTSQVDAGEEGEGAKKAPEAAAAPVVPAPQSDDRKSVAEGRQAVLAAFARGRAQASPQPASPQPATPPPRPQERPWFAGQEASRPQSEMTDDGWRFVLEGYVVGAVAWATKHGPPPRAEGCRVPLRILREFKI